MSNVETTSKVLLKIIVRMNLGGWGARAKLSILDIVHKPLRSLERVKHCIIHFWPEGYLMGFELEPSNFITLL